MINLNYDPILGLTHWKIGKPVNNVKISKKKKFFISKLIASLKAYKIRNRYIRNFQKNRCNSEFIKK